MKKFFIFLLLTFILLTTKQNNLSLSNYFKGEAFSYGDAEVLESVKLENYEPISTIKNLYGEICDVKVLKDGTQEIYFYSPLFKQNIFCKKPNLKLDCFDGYIVISSLKNKI